jgi:AraC-like DNA-binding protein
MPALNEGRILFQETGNTPIGRVVLAGEIINGSGISPRGMRIYGRYGLMIVTSGSGNYRDDTGYRSTLSVGDGVLVFPQWPHWYGPKRGSTWSEIYVVFEGPQFDLWRQVGLISPTHPVFPQATSEGNQIRQLCTEVEKSPLSRLTQFTAILSELVARLTPSSPANLWLSEAKVNLTENLSEPIGCEDVAKKLQMGAESFRKRFTMEAGISPMRYRRERKLESARDLIVHTPMSLRAIAFRLGFADEFTLSKRFKSHFGYSPRQARSGEMLSKGTLTHSIE